MSFRSPSAANAGKQGRPGKHLPGRPFFVHRQQSHGQPEILAKFEILTCPKQVDENALARPDIYIAFADLPGLDYL
jgi:hypothetical protein